VQRLALQCRITSLMAVVLRLLAPGRLPRKVESRAPGFVKITWFVHSAGITEACALRLTLSEMLTDVRCYRPGSRSSEQDCSLSNVEQLSSARLTDNEIGNGRDLKPSLLYGTDVGTVTRSGAELVCLQNGL
jgi:hypothetical protein